MPSYIVNTQQQANGDHEVHNATTGCPYMPNIANQLSLGVHDTCHGAVARAKQTYWQSNGCFYCCPACHTS